MFDKKTILFKSLTKLLDLDFCFKKNINTLNIIKVCKINFSGKVYKLKKYNLIILPKINLAHDIYVQLNNILIKRKKRIKRWWIFSNSERNSILLTSLRLINIYTRRGF
jgi:hypothetical protein